MENIIKIYKIATAIIRNGDKLLIAKRAPTKKFAPNQWEFISGFLDTPETPEQIILREINEELAVTGKIIDTAEEFIIDDEEGQWIVAPFLVEVSGQPEINPGDHSEIKWVTAEELKNYPDLKLFLEGIKKFLI